MFFSIFGEIFRLVNDLFHNFFARETSQNLMFQRLRENSFLLVIESGVAPLFFCWLVGHGRLAIQSAAEVIFRTINLGAGWELLRVCIVLPRKLTWVPPQKIGLFKKESHLPNLELLKFQPLGVFFWGRGLWLLYQKTAKPKQQKTCISSIVIPSHLIKLHAARRSWIPWRWPKIWAISSAWKHGRFWQQTCQAAGGGDRFLVIFC